MGHSSAPASAGADEVCPTRMDETAKCDLAGASRNCASAPGAARSARRLVIKTQRDRTRPHSASGVLIKISTIVEEKPPKLLAGAEGRRKRRPGRRARRRSAGNPPLAVQRRDQRAGIKSSLGRRIGHSHQGHHFGHSHHTSRVAGPCPSAARGERATAQSASPRAARVPVHGADDGDEYGADSAA